MNSSLPLSSTTKRRINTILSHVIAPRPYGLIALSQNTQDKNNTIENDNLQNYKNQNTDNNSQDTQNKNGIDWFGNIDVEGALERVSEMVKEQQYEEAQEIVLHRILPFIPQNSPHLSSRAYRLVGLSYYNQKDFPKAFVWFRKAAQDSVHPNDWFNLCSAAAQAGHLEMSREAFQKLEELHAASGFKLRPSYWQQLYWYILSLMHVKAHNDCLLLLERLRAAYERARFTDTAYLNEIGLPNFQDFIAVAVALFKRMHQLNTAGLQFLSQLSSNVDDAGKRYIENTISQIQKGLDDHQQTNNNN